MRKLLKQVLSLVAIASMGIPLLNAATNDYNIEVKNDAFSKHSRDGLYGITYTEENTTYTDNNWPLAEMSHAYTQSNYSYTLATAQMVLSFALCLDIALFEQGVENMFCEVATFTVCSARCGSEIFECKPLFGHLTKGIHDKSRAVIE